MIDLDTDVMALRELAIHEAGHTVCADALDVPVSSTKLYGDDTGVTELDWSNMTMAELEPRQVGAVMAVFFGGLVAVRHWLHRTGGDPAQAYVRAGSDLASLDEFAQDPRAISLGEAEGRSMDVVGDRWAEVLELAQQLAEASPGWLSGTRTVRA